MTPYISTIAPLRSLAAVLVLLLHCHQFVAPLVDPHHTQLIDKAYLWVDFFFLLSGFVISHVYGQAFAGGIEKKAFRGYLLARFRRIYPLYLFTVLWAVLAIIYLRGQAAGISPHWSRIFDYQGVVTSLLLVQSLGIHSVTVINVPAWSLSVEWWIYLVFPWLVQMIFRSRGRRGAIALQLLGIAVLYALLIYGIAPAWSQAKAVTVNVGPDFGILRCLAGFSFGMLLQEIYRRRWLAGLGNGAIALVSLAITLLSMHYGLPDIVFVLGLFPALLLGFAYNDDLLSRWLKSRPLQRLGDWSYSIYLVHFPVILTLFSLLIRDSPGLLASPAGASTDAQPLWIGWLLAALILTSTVLISAVTYRYVERPLRTMNSQSLKRSLAYGTHHGDGLA